MSDNIATVVAIGDKPVENGLWVKPKVGDILYSSWGYDQTNIEFFKVVKVSEFSVWIQKVGSKVVEVTGWAHQNVVPTDSSEYEVRVSDFDEPAVYETRSYAIRRHKIQPSYSGYGVSLNSYSAAFLWDGKPKGQSQTC
jgi:hypothetical protein